MIARPYVASQVSTHFEGSRPCSRAPLWRGCLETLLIVALFLLAGVAGAVSLERAFGSSRDYPGLGPAPHLTSEPSAEMPERPRTPA